MLKRTLYFGNPAHLRTQFEQLVIELKDSGEVRQVPIEDICIIMLDHHQITLSQRLISKLLANNIALISCDDAHYPTGMMLNLDGHSLQSQKFQAQVESTSPLKKQLWQQTIICKIRNQASLLAQIPVEAKYLRELAKNVKSGDSDNCEARAASFYWRNLFPEIPSFRRERFGPPPNNLLNYGYTILRALIARCLVGSGLLPTLGIFHRNQYNAYCLADDIMEPYRPYVDKIVYDITQQRSYYEEMTPETKKQLLGIPVLDVMQEGKWCPLMNAAQRTTASLAQCYEGKARKLVYPEMTSY